MWANLVNNAMYGPARHSYTGMEDNAYLAAVGGFTYPSTNVCSCFRDGRGCCMVVVLLSWGGGITSAGVKLVNILSEAEL